MRDDEVFIGRFSAIDALGSKTSDPRLFGCSARVLVEWQELFWCQPNGWSIAKCIFFLARHEKPRVTLLSLTLKKWLERKWNLFSLEHAKDRIRITVDFQFPFIVANIA
jgi:hypothetical protein